MLIKKKVRSNKSLLEEKYNPMNELVTVNATTTGQLRSERRRRYKKTKKTYQLGLSINSISAYPHIMAHFANKSVQLFWMNILNSYCKRQCLWNSGVT
jgi:hypothetical protein